MSPWLWGGGGASMGCAERSVDSDLSTRCRPRTFIANSWVLTTVSSNHVPFTVHLCHVSRLCCSIKSHIEG